MSVQDIRRREVFYGSGGGTGGPFYLDFSIASGEDIQVFHVSTTSGSTVVNELDLDDDYVVTLLGDGQEGFYINLTPGFGDLFSPDYIAVVGATPKTQIVPFENQGAFFPEIHGAAFDKLTRIVQELVDDFNGAIRIPDYDDPDYGDMTLPPIEDRALKFLGFDSSGQPIATALGTSTVPVSTYWSTILTLTSFLASRYALGLQLTTPNFVRNPIFFNQFAVLPAAPADNDYICPGWRILMESANAVVPTYENGSVLQGTDSNDGRPYFVYSRMVLTVGSANNNKFGIFQVIEARDGDNLRNVIRSLQAHLTCTAGINIVKMALLSWNGSLDNTGSDPISSWNGNGVDPTLTASWSYATTPVNLGVGLAAHRYKVENIPDNLTGQWNFGVLIWCDDKITTSSTDSLTISNVQLERGQVCTEFVRECQQKELARIQREYEFISGNNRIVGNGQCITTTTAKILVPMKTTKRVVPSLSIIAAGGNAASFSLRKADGTLQALTALTLNATNSTQDVVELDCTVAANLVAGNATQLISNNANALLEFKALL